MDIQFPARDRANENLQKIDSDLNEALKSIRVLKDYLVKRQKYEQVVHLREIEKKIEESLSDLEENLKREIL